MPIVIVTPKPWTAGQELTADDGSKYLAGGANFAKALCEYITVVGAAGSQGPVGDAGPDGANGTNGLNGIDGTDGINGEDGTNGTDGNNGTDGDNGTDGFSPTAACSVTNGVVTISVTNAAGTTDKVLDVCPDPNARQAAAIAQDATEAEAVAIMKSLDAAIADDTLTATAALQLARDLVAVKEVVKTPPGQVGR